MDITPAQQGAQPDSTRSSWFPDWHRELRAPSLQVCQYNRRLKQQASSSAPWMSLFSAKPVWPTLPGAMSTTCGGGLAAEGWKAC